MILCLVTALAVPVTSALASDDITLSDLVRVSEYLAGKTELTPEELNEYDLNGKGGVTLSDLVLMAQELLKEEGGSKPSSSPTPVVTQAPQMLTADEAQQIALDRVPGASKNDIVKCELDVDDLVTLYEVDIRYQGTDYDFEISAYGGVVYQEKWDKRPTPGYNGAPVTLEQAIAAVIDRIPGASAENATGSLDTDDGVQVFDIDVRYNGTEYDAVVVRATGELIEWDMELDRTVQPEPMPGETATAAPSTGAMLTRNEAIQNALSRVPGATEANVTSCELDEDDGIRVYEIEIHKDGTEYDFEIAAYTGALRKESTDKRPTPGFTGSPVDRNGAIEAVLARIPGASASDVRETDVDTEDGVSVYEIEVVYGGREFDAVVVASTGEIITWSVDYRNLPMPEASPVASASPTQSQAPAIPSSTPTAPSQTAAPTQLPSTQAMQIALDRVPGAQVTDVQKCELDHDDGRLVYEIEIEFGGREYDFEIDAMTGQIIEQDIDD